MKKSHTIGLVFGLVLVSIVACTTKQPVSVLPQGVGITLSINRDGTTVHDAYRGGFDTLIMSFDQPVVADFANQIIVHWGSAHYITPAAAFNHQSVSSLRIPIYWITKPGATIDTVNGKAHVRYIDTLYAQVAGSQSNQVIVYVDNIAPIITNIVIGRRDTTGRKGKSPDTTISVQNTFPAGADKMFSYQVDSSQLSVRIRAMGSDADAVTSLKYTWSSVYGQASMHWDGKADSIVYDLPTVNFTDTILVALSDGQGGASEARIRLYRTGGKSPISVTKIAFMDSIFAGDASVYTYTFHTMADSTSMALHAYVDQTSGLISGGWKVLHGTFTHDLTAGVDSAFVGTYVSSATGLADSLKTDTTRLIDSLVLQLSTATGSTLTKSIRLVQTPYHLRPTFKTFLLGGKSPIFNALSITRDTIRVDSTRKVAAITLVATGASADKGVTVGGFTGLSASATGSLKDTTLTTSYMPLTDSTISATYNDTVTVTLVDNMGFMAERKVIFVVIPYVKTTTVMAPPRKALTLELMDNRRKR